MSRLLLLLPLLLLTAACSGRGYVKADSRGLISFRFFLFADIGTERFRGSGDAVLEAGNSFRFRVYDNLLNARLFDFGAAADGRIEIADYNAKLLLRRTDSSLAKALVYALPLFYRDTTADEVKAVSGASDATVRSNRLEAAEFGSGKNAALISVASRATNDAPRTIKIRNGSNTLTLEIVEYGTGDFFSETDGFGLREDPAQTPFLEWLGETYAGR